MGRKQKYATNEDRIAARRERQMRYYWNNAERIKSRNLKNYHEKMHGLSSSKTA